MKKLANMSIKWKIYAYLLCFCAILIVLIWLFQVVFLKDFYENIKLNEIESAAQSIMANIDNEELGELVDRISVSNDVCIEILDSSGAELYSSDILPDCIIHHMAVFQKLELLAKTISQGGVMYSTFSRTDFRNRKYDDENFDGHVPEKDRGLSETLIFSCVARNAQGEIIIVLINSIVTPVGATVKTLRIQIIAITCFMVLFSVALAFFISKNVSRPIVSINESAKALAAGEYGIKFASRGYREINELSATLTHTASELGKVDALRRELIANVSHDLRTPLTLIEGYAEMMRDLPGENNAENAQIIVDETKRLATLVSDMLDISRLQAGAQTPNLDYFDLTDMLEDVCTRIGELVRQDGYAVAFSGCGSAIVYADQAKISQAFYNLLINAIHYTGEDKRVAIRETDEGGSVLVEIEDDGEGIAPENLPYVWERYYKIDKTHKRAVTGTGLGLSIVKGVMEMHGAEYGVRSAPGEGSVFWFRLHKAELHED